MAAEDFLARLVTILRDLRETQREAFAAVAEQMTRTIAGGGLVHLFGSGHSVLPVMDTFPRYGSFVGFNPLTDPRLMWSSVLGPGGIRELLWLERAEGYVEHFLSHEAISPGDTLIVFSHSGQNAAPVEAAKYGRTHGAAVVAVTSARTSGCPLAGIADLVIDTGVPAADALMAVAGWPAPVAGASTIVACAWLGELITLVAGKLAARGIALPTLVSPAAPNPSAQSNDDVIAAHEQRVRKAALRCAR